MLYYHKISHLSTANSGGFFILKSVYTVYQDSGFRIQGPGTRDQNQEQGARDKEQVVRS